MPKVTEHHVGEFKALDEHVKTRKIIGFDSEDDSKGSPVSFAFYSDEGPYYCRTRQAAIDYIYSIKMPSVFMAHNLEYDLNNVFKEEHWHFYEKLVYTSSLISARLKNRPALFIDSGNFFKAPLSAMGKIVGLPKIEGEEQDALNKDYVIRDAQIVYLFGKKFQKFLNEELAINIAPTIGSLSMRAYRSRFMPSPVIRTYNHPDTLRAYYGGRVEIFYKGVKEGPIKVSDINSSYPNVMLNEPYPDTSSISPSSIDTHEYGYGEFTVHVPPSTFIPPLPVKTEAGRLFFPVGTLRGWWTYAEMRYAMECGAKIIKEHYGRGTNLVSYPFTRFIPHFYDKRQIAKRLANDDPDNPDHRFNDLLYKLLMNNLYGKFAQHLPSSEMSRRPFTRWEEEKLGGEILSIQKRLGFYLYRIAKYKPPATANYLWGVYITSYARMNLHRGLRAIHNAGGTLMYCDTDSIMYSGLDTCPLPLSSKLGEWDEEEYDLGYFDQSKGYFLCRKTDKPDVYDMVKAACKGVPTRARYPFFMEGKTVFRKPIKLRESLVLLRAHRAAKQPSKIESELSANYWRAVEKRMRSVYIKRSGHSGVTKPVDAAQIPSLERAIDKGENISISTVLSDMGITVKSTRFNQTDKFSRTVVPDGWYDQQHPLPPQPDYELQPAILYPEDTETLPPGREWLAGIVNESDEKHYYLDATRYMGTKAPADFRVRIPRWFIEHVAEDQKFFNKFCILRVRTNYIIDGPNAVTLEIPAPQTRTQKGGQNERSASNQTFEDGLER